jgi:hypothetical protein
VITLTLHSSRTPPTILGALRAHAGEWRESHIPDALQRAGIFAVESTVVGTECTLACARRWYAGLDRVAPLRLRARVDPDPAGGTAVRVSVSREVRSPVASLALVVFVLAGVALLRFPVWLMVAMVASAAGLTYALVRDANRGLTAGEPEAGYLLSRLESAIADANAASTVAPSSEFEAEA